MIIDAPHLAPHIRSVVLLRGAHRAPFVRVEGDLVEGIGNPTPLPHDDVAHRVEFPTAVVVDLGACVLPFAPDVVRGAVVRC